MTNDDFEKIVDTSDEWILQRTGIHERHICSEEEFSSDLAIGAVENLVDVTGASLDEVDLIIVTTFTPDYLAPHVASVVQGYFGIPHTGTFDLGAGCTGFTYALSVADALITSGQNKKILVVAAEAVSKTVDYSDRTSCILFGDAGAACLLEYTEDEGAFLACRFHTDGDLAHHVTCSNFSQTINGETITNKATFDQNGQQVYKYVMQHIPTGVEELVAKAGIAFDEIDWFIPHSANMRMIQTICNKLNFPEEKTLTSLEQYGNTSSVSIPLALWIAQQEGRLQKGDILALYGFGAGLTHGGVVVRF